MGPAPTSEIPFCIGIVGDFSGRSTRAEVESHRDIPNRRLRRVTPENVLSLAGISPRILLTELPNGIAPQTIRFSSMEDFHPDELFRRMEVFSELRAARERILSGGSGGEGGESKGDRNHTEAGEGGGSNDASTGDAAGGVTESPPEAGLLDAILGETERDQERQEELDRGKAPPGSPLNEDLDDFIKRIVKPHAIEPAADASQQMEELDNQASRVMSAIMHAQAFQETEALWRGVVFLLSRIQVSTHLRVYLIDVSQAELAADLLSSDEPTEWGFAHTVLNPVSENGEELRWSALIGGFGFGSDPLHVPLLQRIGLLAESGQVPWLAQADARLLGAESLENEPEPRDWSVPPDPLWEELRGKPEADWIGLALPGFLLRPPYGSEGRKTKAFRFLESKGARDRLLWGNPALLMAVVLAQEFAGSGWAMRLGGRYGVSQIPTHTKSDGGVSCLQAHLSHSGAAGALERGLNPVVGPLNEANVHFGAPIAISASGTGIRAWWKTPA